MVVGIFKIALGLRDRYVFMSQSLEILNVFNTLTLKQIFWKTKTFFKKLKHNFFERLKMQDFHRKLPSQKINRMGSTKWTYQKNSVFPVTALSF